MPKRPHAGRWRAAATGWASEKRTTVVRYYQAAARGADKRRLHTITAYGIRWPKAPFAQASFTPGPATFAAPQGPPVTTPPPRRSSRRAGGTGNLHTHVHMAGASTLRDPRRASTKGPPALRDPPAAIPRGGNTEGKGYLKPASGTPGPARARVGRAYQPSGDSRINGRRGRSALRTTKIVRSPFEAMQRSQTSASASTGIALCQVIPSVEWRMCRCLYSAV